MVNHLTKRKCRELKIQAPPQPAAGAIDRLMAYHWPGNMRELENVIEQALILSKGAPLVFDDLLGEKQNRSSATTFIPENGLLKLDELMSHHIRRVLEITNGKMHGKAAAAEVLGINPSTLRNRMNQLEIFYGKRRKPA